MTLRDVLKQYVVNKFSPTAAAVKPQPKDVAGDIFIKIHQEFKDRSRKNIDKWRWAILAAEDVRNPRWADLQDIIDELMFDAHLASVIGIRKAATLNHPFYIVDKKSSEQNEELNAIINRSWFYQFLNYSIDSIFRKVALLELTYNGVDVRVDLIPFRNVCPQLKRVYPEAFADGFIDYSKYPNVIELLHDSPFGLVNDVIPNVIWKRNAMQSYAEFTERFGMPLVSATVSNIQDSAKAEKALKEMGESATAVFPQGADIKVHSLANAGNPESTYVASATFHDQQISKRIIGSTTLTDEGANRSQTQVHAELLDDKISLMDKRMIAFAVNDRLFPVLQSFGLPFDNTKFEFKFDDNENLTLSQHWEIVRDALIHYELDENELRQTFNLPIIAPKRLQPNEANDGGLTANFR